MPGPSIPGYFGDIYTYGGGGTATSPSTTTTSTAPIATLAGLFANAGRPGRAFGSSYGAPQESSAQSTIPNSSTYSYPEAVSRPSYLQSVLGMTPLQERAHIATGATSGQNTAFGGSDVFDYYKNLAMRSLLTPSGGFAEGGQVLPVEQDYLTKIMRRQPADQSVKSFVDALLRN